MRRGGTLSARARGVLRQAERFHEFLAKNFARMNRRQFIRFHNRSVIINNFNVKRIFALPPETNAPLVIDPNAMLAFAIHFQRFQMIARWNSQIVQTPRLADQKQFPPRHSLNLRRQPSRRFIVKQPFGFRASKLRIICGAL